MSASREHGETCRAHNVRCETLIYLPAILVDPEYFPDAFETFCEELPGDETHELFSSLPELRRFAEWDDELSQEEIAAELLDAERSGFLAQFATPVRDERGGYYDWGTVRLRWFYGESLDDVVASAARWARPS